MRIFITGGSGWIGSAVVPELIGAGHQILGLARSDATANALTEMGAEVLRGDLDDLDALRRARSKATASSISPSSCRASPRRRRGPTPQRSRPLPPRLAGSGKPMLITGGTIVTPGPSLDRARRAHRPRADRRPHHQHAGGPRRRRPRRACGVGHAATLGARPGERHGFIPQLIAAPGTRASPATSATAPTAGRPFT